jgi:hypothetical protein
MRLSGFRACAVILGKHGGNSSRLDGDDSPGFDCWNNPVSIPNEPAGC